MISKFLAASLIFLLLLQANGTAQDSQSPTSSQDLAQHLKDGGRVAILDSSKSGSHNLIPALHILLSDQDQSIRDAATLALARLGDEAQFLSVGCRFVTSQNEAQLISSANDMEYVGGWSAMRLLLDWAPRKSNRIPSAQSIAFAALVNIIDSAAMQEVGQRSWKQAKTLDQLREWITAHKNELVSVTPNRVGFISPSDCR